MSTPVFDVDLRAVLDGMDSRRRRSRQRAPGASDVGTCRRRVAYKLAGQPVDNRGDKRKAIQGTLLHRGVLAACKTAHGGYTEVRVDRPGVIRGSADWLRQDPLGLWLVDDVKTVGRDNYESTVRGPVSRPHLWQVHIYADLIRRGEYAATERRLADPLDVVDLELLYLCRDDGRTDSKRIPFQQDVADEAFAWVEEVRLRTEVDGAAGVPRDLPGPWSSVICRNCPFVRACWKWNPETDEREPLELAPPDLEEWVRRYNAAARAESAAKDEKALARAHLDGQPAMRWPSGWELKWTGGGEKWVEVPDTDALVQEFTDVGLPVPTLTVNKTRPPAISVLPPRPGRKP